jgi:hypothetical protein
VATAFTGAAACAVALAPAAEAAPAAPGATARITPDAVAGDCNRNVYYTSSVHLYYTASENHTSPACIGGDGYVYIGTGKRFASYCAGAYSGSLEINGTFRHFTAGRHYLYGAQVSGIYISGEPNPGTTCPF